ncbi:phosphatase domain-containing protein [Bdellovibrio sp. HCB2-146]|uniref:phosphatase domain-containing protein n=1 Tax=Bdellovibrio sp. HCB2-146 TaxID=3394362 RepID=UPI0039BD4D54
MKKYGALILGLALSWQSVEAKTILISDIDDTIKNSHILDLKDKLLSPTYTENSVRGMSQIYEIIRRQYADKGETLPFFYVTNAPWKIMGKIHTSFLSKHGFPQGAVLFREDLDNKEHKVETITELLATEKPDTVIFVGDNGEKDILVYNTFTSDAKYSNIKFFTYIRMPYYSVENKESLALLPKQEGFATSFDLLLSWVNNGLVDAQKIVSDDKKSKDEIDWSASVENFIVNFTINLADESETEKHGVLSFPHWMDCRDVQVPNDSLRNLTDEVKMFAVVALDTVQKRCSTAARPKVEND